MNLDKLIDSLDIETEGAISNVKKMTEFMQKRNHEKNEEIDVSTVVRKADYKSFLPAGEVVLGLDVSKSSTGWCLIQDKVKRTGNIHLTGYVKREYPSHPELAMRLELKERLKLQFEGMEFDHIMIEDVYQGTNAKTVRLLYDINTAIDELIVEGTIKCKKFHRISNQKWKGWLYKIDSLNEYKAMVDKPRIQACLAMLGVTERGEGYQDRLDATGLVIGYFMNEVSINKTDNRKKKLIMSDIVLRYRPSIEEAKEIKKDVLAVSDGPIEIKATAPSLQLFEKYLLNNPDGIFVTSEPIPLGILSAIKQLKPIKGGGYLAFWIRPDKRSKYIE